MVSAVSLATTALLRMGQLLLVVGRLPLCSLALRSTWLPASLPGNMLTPCCARPVEDDNVKSTIAFDEIPGVSSQALQKLRMEQVEEDVFVAQDFFQYHSVRYLMSPFGTATAVPKVAAAKDRLCETFVSARLGVGAGSTWS